MSNQVPLSEALVVEPVTLINAFTVPLHESDRFLRRWKDNARIMAGQPGFIRARMYKSLVEDAELRFINMAEWSSGEALAKARATPDRAEPMPTLSMCSPWTRRGGIAASPSYAFAMATQMLPVEHAGGLH